jgi:hypothetical protein
VEEEKTSIARLQQAKQTALLGSGSVNRSPWQRICARNSRRTVGSGVFCGFRPEAMYRELKPIGLYLAVVKLNDRPSD